MANIVLDRTINHPPESQAGWAAGGPPGVVDVGAVDRMSVGGVVSATGVLFVLLLATGAYGWSLVDPAPEGFAEFPTWTLFAILVGFGAVIGAMLKPHLAKFLAPVYALAEGIFLGAISHAYENEWNGIVTQAVLITAVVFATMLFLYATRIIKVTERMRRVIISATIAVGVFYLFSFLLSIFGVGMPLIWDAGPLGIAFSFAMVGLAAFNLVVDFDLVDRGVQGGLPKQMEWVCALGLMVTIVWLYLEMLRLLSKLRQ
jgi:uncharacterized YccA/Bax inhibitor family protein